MDIFTMARLMAQLPRNGRLYRLAAEDELSFQDHLMLNLVDLVSHTAYYTTVAARAQVSGKEWPKVARGAPQPLPRPGKKQQEPSAEEAKKDAVYVHPRDALTAVSRMIHVKAMRQTGMM